MSESQAVTWEVQDVINRLRAPGDAFVAAHPDYDTVTYVKVHKNDLIERLRLAYPDTRDVTIDIIIAPGQTFIG